MKINYLIGGIIIAVFAFFAFRFFGGGEFKLPAGNNARSEKIIVENGEVIENPNLAKNNEILPESDPIGGEKKIKNIMVTDGVRHAIPLEEILSGGPPKDGIPSIDNPIFLNPDDADFMEDENPGIGVALGDDARFYPYRILVWHEIVNDEISGKPVVITYCPLCATGVVYERKIGSETVEFGVSGKLWQSNLLMYDRRKNDEEESLWSQVLGEAVVGPKTGTELKIIPSDITRWGKWKSAYPNTKVLSTDTGSSRNYSADPYGSYYTSAEVGFGATFQDKRLHPKKLVYGIKAGDTFKAYDIDALKRDKEFKDSVGENKINVRYQPATDSVKFTDAEGNSIPYVAGFWFSWSAVHPDTELYK